MGQLKDAAIKFEEAVRDPKFKLARECYDGWKVADQPVTRVYHARPDGSSILAAELFDPLYARKILADAGRPAPENDLRLTYFF